MNIILYHGTKFKHTVEKIQRHGFASYSYFARNLADAIHMGGKYVFAVAFIESNLPDNWQVRCANRIPPHRIVSLTKYIHTDIMKNKKKLGNNIFSNALEEPAQPDYIFQEGN